MTDLRHTAVLVLGFALVALVMACSGPQGPQGEVGPQGPPGDAGPAGEQGQPAIAIGARHDMNMHVRNLLAGERPVVHADTEVGRAEMSTESTLHLHHPLHQARHALGGEFSEVLLLLHGNDERVPRTSGEDVEEGHPGISLGDERRGNLPVDDLREQTGFHPTPPAARHFRMP